MLHARTREHSRKPEVAYQMVEALYPNARRLDAFTREYRAGWDAFGDQIDHFSPLFACLRGGVS
jgi:N6-adenosine-specific RNA methylase IME4